MEKKWGLLTSLGEGGSCTGAPVPARVHRLSRGASPSDSRTGPSRSPCASRSPLSQDLPGRPGRLAWAPFLLMIFVFLLKERRWPGRQRQRDTRELGRPFCVQFSHSKASCAHQVPAECGTSGKGLRGLTLGLKGRTPESECTSRSPQRAPAPQREPPDLGRWFQSHRLHVDRR